MVNHDWLRCPPSGHCHLPVVVATVVSTYSTCTIDVQPLGGDKLAKVDLTQPH